MQWKIVADEQLFRFAGAWTCTVTDGMQALQCFCWCLDMYCDWWCAGFTVFLERKIIGRLNGEKALQFQAANGYLNLVDAVHELGETHNFTALVPDLSGGVDPDDSFSKIPYEKGFYFLYYLQVQLRFLYIFFVTCINQKS